MKNRTYSIITLLGIWEFFSSSAIAGQAPPSASIFSRGRIGFGLAGEYMNSEVNLNIRSSGGNLNDSIKIDHSQTAKKLQISPSIELGTTISNDYYLGLLVSWRYSGAKNVSRIPLRGSFYFLNSFTLKQYADFLVKAGYICAPRVMIFGLIGPSLAGWTHTTDFLDNQVTGNQALVDKFKVNKTSLGLGVGVGFEYFLHKKYAISVNYTRYFHRTASNSKNISFQEFIGRGLRPRSGDLIKNIRPSYSTIAIRFTTYFQL